MSCWRTYTCDVLKNVNPNLVKMAVSQVEKGLALNTNMHTVTGYGRSHSKVDGVIMRNANPISLGIIFNDTTGHMQVVGDFWNTGIDEKTFVDALSQQYQILNIQANAQAMGYQVDAASYQKAENGSVTFDVVCCAC